MVQREIRKAEEETRHVKAVTMKKQGSWTRWEGARDLAGYLEHGRTPDKVLVVFCL